MEQEYKKVIERLEDESKKSQAKVMELQIAIKEVTRQKDQTEAETSTCEKTIKSLERSVKNYKVAVKKHDQTLGELGMDNFPRCQICHAYFTLKGPVPYLLPCLHAVCETCVTSTAGGVISCSTCQREVNITESHLQKDVVRQREIFHLTVKHRPSELLCTHEDDGNQAVCWCRVCEEFLCEYCQTLHESFKAMRKHAVQEIADIQPGSLDQEEFCSIHTSHPLDFWDKECNCLICGRCRRDDHAQHDVVDVDEAADVARSEFETHEKEVHRIGENHHSLHQTTQEQLRLADVTYDTLQNAISHTFQSLKVLLDQREKELIITLQQYTDKVKSQLDSKATVEQSSHLRCKLTTEYITKVLLYSSKYDLLKLKKTIGNTTQVCLHSAPAEKQENIPLTVFKNEQLEELKSTLSTFGEIVTLNDLSSQSLLAQETFDYKAQLETMEQEYKKVIERLEDESKKSQAKVMELQIAIKEVTRQKDQTEAETSTCEKTIKSLERSVKNYKVAVKKHEQTLGELGLSPDTTYHPLKTNILDKSFILQCFHLKYDTEKVNIKWTHINDAGELVNKPDTTAGGGTSGRFQKYSGTTSTNPLFLTDSPQYIEVLTNVRINESVQKMNLILNTGICTVGDSDVMHSIPLRQYCYGLEVFQCPDHDSVCTRVCKDGNAVHHLRDTLPNTAGTHIKLHHGVVYHTMKNRIVFLDVTQMKVIGALDNVEYSQPMWPMFGLCVWYKARLSMKLVVGNDIDMTPEKKAMILKVL